MFVRPDFWGAADCLRIRRAMDRGAPSPAEIYADGFRVDEATRRAFDVEVDAAVIEDVQRTIDAARLQVSEFFGIPLSRDEGPGFLRYMPGGFYRVHHDVAPGGDEEFPRRISVVVFLT